MLIILKFSNKLSYHSFFVLFYTLDFWAYIFSLAKSNSLMGIKISPWMDTKILFTCDLQGKFPTLESL